jgi:hypothetical protein
MARSLGDLLLNDKGQRLVARNWAPSGLGGDPEVSLSAVFGKGHLEALA